jgi:uncharacterized protein with von Willebrand factor type A (vWA) domain
MGSLMADETQEVQKEVLASMADRKLTQREVNALMDTLQVLSSAMSNMAGTYFTAGDHWRANVETGEITYDLGLAAALDREAQIGVSGHEIAHLRFTQSVKFKRGWSRGDSDWVFHIVNILEDRRIENLMVAEFPGLAGNIERLRAAFDKPLVVRAAQMAEPHVQFLGGVYAAAFDREFTATNPAARDALEQYRDEVRALTRAKGSRQIAREVERDGGIADAMFRLRDELTQQQATQRDPAAVAQQPLPDAEQPPADWPDVTAGGGEADAPDGEGQDGTPEPGSGNEGENGEPGGGESAPGGEPGGENAPGSAAGDKAEGGSGNGAGDADGEAAGKGWAPSQDDLAALPGDMGEVIAKIARSAETMGELGGGELDEHVRADAEQLARSLSGMRDMVGSVRRSVQAAQDQDRGAVDDDRCSLKADGDKYIKILTAVNAEASVLGRQLGQVLAENRADRLASTQYRDGQRLSMPGLMRAVVDPNYDTVYRRRGRAKNRRYAFGILGDVSGSMAGEKMAQMAYTTVLASAAVERAGGCDVGVYAFATDCAVLKPFSLSLDLRGGYIGSIHKQSLGGGRTMVGNAIERVGADMLRQFDDSWRRVILVITDGIPTDGPVAEKNVRSLIRHDDFDFVGIGIDINDPGRMAQMFPHWVALADAWELGPALIRMMRKVVVKG